MTPETPPPAEQNDLYGLPGYTPTQEERTWVLLAHLSGIVVGFLGALVVMLTKGAESKWVRAHAVEALNFQLTLLIAYVVGFVGTFVFVGICLLAVAAIGSIILSVVAGVKGYGGGAYRYPATIRFIKA